MRLVLASRSPRRVDLLTRAGYRFEVAPADIDERRRGGEAPRELVRRLAREKAAAVAPRHPGAVVLGADTLVVVDGAVLGKPDGAAGAAAMLRRLSGRAHEVLTGVALHTADRCRDGVQSTRVVFRALSPGDVEWYVATGESADKAGSYSIQGRASRFVTRIEGSYTNVVGLPIELVDDLLRELARPSSPSAPPGAQPALQEPAPFHGADSQPDGGNRDGGEPSPPGPER